MISAQRRPRRGGELVRPAVQARAESDESDRPTVGAPMSSPFFDLSGRVAIVTGASRGLGQYFRALARPGADLDHHQPNARLTARLSEGDRGPGPQGPCRWNWTCATSRASRQWPTMLAAAYGEDRHPGQQRRLQCAQAGAGDHLGRLEPGARNQSTGTFFVAQTSRKDLIPHGYGRIINIGSVHQRVRLRGACAIQRQPRRREAA